MSFSFADKIYIDPTAIIIGNVKIHEGASIWPYAVVRGDANLIEIGEGSNIQEHVMIHVDHRDPAFIGKNVSVGHGAVIHGAHIGDRCIIGMHSTILNGAEIGDDAIIGAGTVITSGMRVPPKSIVVGVPGKIIKENQESNREAAEINAKAYHVFRDEYIAGKHKRYMGP
jgi:carbonic anhydrase/acetyltransferase-like protein (isoleucine patch superfamily)